MCPDMAFCLVPYSDTPVWTKEEGSKSPEWSPGPDVTCLQVLFTPVMLCPCLKRVGSQTPLKHCWGHSFNWSREFSKTESNEKWQQKECPGGEDVCCEAIVQTGKLRQSVTMGPPAASVKSVWKMKTFPEWMNSAPLNCPLKMVTTRNSMFCVKLKKKNQDPKQI
jgi:hypothetical protein